MKLVLASHSPRRRELLENLGVSFEVKVSQADESFDTTKEPKEIAMDLAYRKAKAVAKAYEGQNAIIIAADTIVVAHEILNKPIDMADAIRILKLLSGQSHHVITGIALIHGESKEEIWDFVSTKVTFKTLSDEEINTYIASGEPWDKAGAYGIQGKAALFVEKIEGDYFNVVGMPLFKLEELLKKHFKISLL